MRNSKNAVNSGSFHIMTAYIANDCGMAKNASAKTRYQRLTPLLSSHVKNRAYTAAITRYCVSEYKNTPSMMLPNAAPIRKKIATNSV